MMNSPEQIIEPLCFVLPLWNENVSGDVFGFITVDKVLKGVTEELGRQPTYSDTIFGHSYK